MEPTSNTGPEFAHAVFDDVDLFADFVKALDWDLESTQLSSGPYKLEFETFEFPDMSVSRLTTRQSLYDRFTVPDDALVLSMARKKLPATWNGRRFPPSMMGVFHPGIDHWVVLPAGWDGYEFTISRRLVRQTGLIPDDFFAKSRQFEHAHVPLAEPVTGAFLDRIDALFAFARNRRIRGESWGNASELSDLVLLGLLEVLDAGLAAGGKSRLVGTRRADLVARATDIVESMLESQVSTQALMQELNVSARVLHYAFKDALGVSPNRYIQTRRLHAVHRELKSSEEPIIEIISRYGFATPSRFGHQYKRLFGELPSATKRRR